MPTREQVLRIVRSGLDYHAAGRSLGVPAGLAYMVATGLPADGGDAPAPEDLEREGALRGSTQHLANPSVSNPTSKDQVSHWVTRRAQADSQMQQAARYDNPDPGPMSSEEERPDVADELTHHHNQINGLVKKLTSSGGGGGSPGGDGSAELVRLISGRIQAHDAAEEAILWPAVRARLDDGPAVADQARRQEDDLRSATEALCRPGAGDDSDQPVSRLSSAFRHHVAYEDSVFLALREAMSEDERRQLGTRLRQHVSAGGTGTETGTTTETGTGTGTSTGTRGGTDGR